MATVREIKPTKKVVTQINTTAPIRKQKLRVAAYARVSTNQDEQENSYELQISEYTKRINNNPEWVFVDMYSDKGISGTSLKNREGFKLMIKHALAGKIDLILTKSISRFGRNVADILKACQDLREKGVEIRFEKENLTNMNNATDFLLTIMSGLSQEESRSISDNVTWAVRKRFKEGIHRLNTTNLYGYDRDADDNIIFNKEEADVVRRIYFAFLEGLSPYDIARELNENGIPSPKKKKWNTNSILGILGNEKFCGDAILQKTYTTSYLSHKRVKNEGQVPSYYVSDDHIPIVDRDIFEKAKVLLEAYKCADGRTSSMNLPLYNIVYCATCGEVMKRVPGADGRNKLWCNFLRKEGSCSAGYTNYDDVLEATTDAIKSMVDMESIRKEINEILSQAYDVDASTLKIDALEKEVATLIKNIDKLINMKIKSNEISESDFNAKYRSLKKEVDEKEKLLEQLTEENNKKRADIVAFKVSLEQLTGKNEIVSSNMLFRRLFRCILYKEKTIYLILNTPDIAVTPVKEIIKTYEKTRVLFAKDMVFSARRHLSYKVITYGKQS